jgi:hypothetical protein
MVSKCSHFDRFVPRVQISKWPLISYRFLKKAYQNFHTVKQLAKKHGLQQQGTGVSMNRARPVVDGSRRLVMR